MRNALYLIEIFMEVMFNMVAVSHMWLLSTRNVASARKEFFLILFNLNYFKLRNWSILVTQKNFNIFWQLDVYKSILSTLNFTKSEYKSSNSNEKSAFKLRCPVNSKYIFNFKG